MGLRFRVELGFLVHAETVSCIVYQLKVCSLYQNKDPDVVEGLFLS